MTASVRNIVDGALELVGQVAGSGVQVYADDFAKRCAVRAFDMMFTKRDWDHYTLRVTATLDATTGIVTQELFERVRNFEDFLAVYRDGQSKPLPVMDHKRNWMKLTGSRVQCWTSLPVSHPQYKKRKLQFYPVTSEGPVQVVAREYPLVPPAVQWGWSDIMHLDTSLMEEATAFVMLSVDAINADAAAVCKSMMESRYADIVASLGSRPVHVRGTADIPDQWYVTR